MIRVLCRRPGGGAAVELPPSDIAATLADPAALLWVDFLDEPDESCERLLREVFSFHPLAIDDAIQESHVPRVDDWGAYLYLVLHAVAYDPASDEPLATRELDVFLGRNYVVTHRDDSIGGVERVWTLMQRDDRFLEQGAAHLAYHLVDELASDAMVAVDAIDAEVEGVEERLLAEPGAAALQQLLRVKRALMHLRRLLAPQREVLNRMARDEYAVIPQPARVYFRDVYDHLVRLHDIVEGIRDLASGALDMYLSVINNRMNDVMKTLTLITVLFMPLGALTGFFGMNFFAPSLPFAGWTGRIAFGVLCGLLGLVPMSMYLWLRRRRRT
jgi:magnesium transporter